MNHKRSNTARKQDATPAGPPDDTSSNLKGEIVQMNPDQETINVGGKSFQVIERIQLGGPDVAPAVFPVVRDGDGKRKAIVSGELRAITTTGQIRAKRMPSAAPRTEDPKTITLNVKSFRVLTAIATITGVGMAEVIENGLLAIANANDVPDALLNRIVSRFE